MMRISVLIFILIAAAFSGPVHAQYENVRPSRDGIGKIYMGREIAQVMGHLGAPWLERSERAEEEGTALLIANLPLESDDVVADIGAGTGYFSFRMAARVPQGKVLAVDVQPEMLDIVRARIAQGLGDNVEPVLGREDNPNLPENTVDLILMVDAYHEFAYPKEMGEAMVKALKRGGKIALVEYRAEDNDVPIKRLHKMSQKQAIAEMSAVGLAWRETLDLLPWQHLMIFEKPKAD